MGVAQLYYQTTVMRLIRLFLALSLLVVVASASAQEPTIVVVNGKKCIVHTISEGDTLYSLSKRYDVTLKSILDLNEAIQVNNIALGEAVYIPYNAKAHKKHKDHAAEVIEKAVAEVEQAAETVAEEFTEAVAETTVAAEEAVEAIASEESVEQVAEELTEVAEELVDGVRVPEFQRFSKGETLDVLLLLPMHYKGKVAGTAFVDFYRGSLLALEDLRRIGYSVNVSVFDTERTESRLQEIISSVAFEEADLIIGPIYADELKVVLPYAEERNIPVVTPLSDINAEEVSSPVLFQMQADSKYHYQKYAHLFDGSYQINIIYGPSNDSGYLNEVLEATKGLSNVRHLNISVGGQTIGFYLRNADGSNGASVALKSLIPLDGHSVVAVVADRDYVIEKALKVIGEEVKKCERGVNDCVFIGNRKWDDLAYLDRSGFFQTALSVIAPYNAKRTDNNAIRVFESRYLSTYGLLPTPFACRGYDAFMMFCTKMFTGLDKTILLEKITPLATPYIFKFEDGMFVNTEWVNIQYQRDFTIRYE